MTPPKQNAVDHSLAMDSSQEQNVDTEGSTLAGIIITDKPKKTVPKQKKVDKPSITKKVINARKLPEDRTPPQKRTYKKLLKSSPENCLQLILLK